MLKESAVTSPFSTVLRENSPWTVRWGSKDSMVGRCSSFQHAAPVSRRFHYHWDHTDSDAS